MSTMEIMCLIALTTLTNLGCFLIGAKTGQKVIKNEPIELPNLNPIDIVKNYEQKREEDKKEKEYRENLEAINNYDGNI